MTEVVDRFVGRWAMLCNFTPAELVWQGLRVPTSEHAYNAGKTLDGICRYKIAKAGSPRIAKRRGRAAPLRPDWQTSVCYDVMRDVLRTKFSDPRRAAVLLSTGNALLIEGNTWHDQNWGDCRCGHRLQCATPGRNHLGRLLMELREELSRA